MRKFLFSFILGLICFFFTNSLQAQRSLYKPQVHQIDILAGSGHMFPSRTYSLNNESAFSLTPLSGIRYTYRYSLTHGFRLGLHRRTTHIQDAQPDDSKGPIQKDYEVHLGYAYTYHKQQHQFYGGLDLMMSAGSIKNEIAQGGAQGTESISYMLYGPDVFAGYRIFLSPYLSLFAEADVQYLTGHPDNEAGEYLGEILLENKLSPRASVGLSFHFVKMKKRCTCPKFR